MQGVFGSNGLTICIEFKSTSKYGPFCPLRTDIGHGHGLLYLCQFSCNKNARHEHSVCQLDTPLW